MRKLVFTFLLFVMTASIADAQFIVYRELFFTGQPSGAYFDSLGFRRSDGIYQGEVTTNGTVVESKMRSTAQAATQLQLFENRVWYDIEYLDCRAQYVGDATAHANALQLAKFIGWAKAAAPSLQIGLYEIVPVTDLWMAGRLSQTQHWNDQLQVLADTLDFLCPSIYLYYPESKMAYSYYAGPLVTEAKRLAKGKKVFAFVAPGYHPAGDLPGQYASYSVFKNVLNVIKNSGADGMIVFAGRGAMGGQYGEWSRADTSGWWRAMKEFMQSLQGDPVTPTPLAPPSVVSPLPSAVVDTLGFTARWQAVTGAIRYQMQLSRSSSFQTTVVNDSSLTGTERQVGALLSGTNYYFRLRSRGNAGWGSYGTTVQISTPTTPPTVLNPRKGSKGQPSSLNSRWNRSRGATSYHLQVSEDNSFGTLVVNDSTLTDTVRQVSLKDNTMYYLRVRSKGTSVWSNFTGATDFQTGPEGSSGTEEERNLPTKYALDQNYPNPFNPNTVIRFSLPTRSYVTLTVFTSLGQQILSLVKGEYAAGIHEVKLDGSGLASGTYFYRMQTDAFFATKKFILIK